MRDATAFINADSRLCLPQACPVIPPRARTGSPHWTRPAGRPVCPRQNINQCQYQPSRASGGDPVYDRERTTPPAHVRAASPRRVPTLNPDGISVKGCTYIYAPKGEALEYSALSANPCRGCGHKCAYCFVPKQLHMKRRVFNARAIERRDYLVNLTRDARKYQALGVTEQVILSFTTDP